MPTPLLDIGLAQTTLHPFGLEVERADGVFIYTTDGKRYMDFISGIGVNNLGHGHLHIKQALHNQIEKHLHVMVYGEYLQASQKKAAELLTAALPSSLNTCYFVNSGTEAIEAALKLAKRVTGRTQLIACKGAYHGNTHGSMSVSHNEKKKSAFRPLLPDVQFITFNAIADLENITTQTACVIAETIQGDAGVRIPDAAWLQALRARCTETGTLLILDEIQCGMGRSGSLFAFEQFGIVPDILVLGKALGGGVPVGCFVSSRDHMALLTHDPMLGHISTFAGHPLICAGVTACLEVFKNEQVVTPIEHRGQRIAAFLRNLPHVKEVRQRGYYFAIDMPDEEHVRKVVEYCMDHGVITFWFLSCPWSFRIAPPLTISEKEIDEALAVIEQAIRLSAQS
ncbi:MAG: aspartate aminotransferase family protein [Flavobacteriales bacterium]